MLTKHREVTGNDYHGKVNKTGGMALRSALFLMFSLVLISQCAKSEEIRFNVPTQYSYVDVSVGTFLDACRSSDCEFRDGKLPSYIALGHQWDIHNQWAVGFEFTHRSNLDAGGHDEYDRNGFFVKARYKFNFVR